MHAGTVGENSMEREIELLERVANFLKDHAYPEEAIILEWKISDRLRVDMAVIDPKTKRPVALFELKRRRTAETDNIAIAQIKRYAQALGDSTLPLYIVYGTDTPPFFEILFLSEKNGNEVLKPVYQVPSFTNFQNSSFTKLLLQKEKEKKKTYDWFWIICWGLAFIIVALLCFDFKGWFDLTPERLGIIAIIVGLVIVPFARKLSILGLEFERLQENKDK